MTDLYGGVETGGSWCVCALGTGPDRIEALERFPTAEPRETVARIVGFFERHGRPRALGLAAFGPIELDPRGSSWGTLGATPKPGWAGWPLGSSLREALTCRSSSRPTSPPPRWASSDGERARGARASAT